MRQDSSKSTTLFSLIFLISLPAFSQMFIGAIGGVSYDSGIESQSEVVFVGTGGVESQRDGDFIGWKFNPSIGITADIQFGEQEYNETYMNVSVIYKPTKLEYSNELTFDLTYLEVPLGVISFPFDNRNLFVTGHIAPTFLMDEGVETARGLLIEDIEYNNFDLRFKGGGGIKINKDARVGLNFSFSALSFIDDDILDINNVYVGLDLAYFINK